MSGSKSDGRVPVTVRLTVTGLAEIDTLATGEDRDRSSMIRVLLKEAIAARQKPGKVYRGSESR